ncbi:hypothetical protein GCM10009780_57970 [Actinomadura alba]
MGPLTGRRVERVTRVTETAGELLVLMAGGGLPKFVTRADWASPH